MTNKKEEKTNINDIDLDSIHPIVLQIVERYRDNILCIERDLLYHDKEVDDNKYCLLYSKEFHATFICKQDIDEIEKVHTRILDAINESKDPIIYHLDNDTFIDYAKATGVTPDVRNKMLFKHFKGATYSMLQPMIHRLMFEEGHCKFFITYYNVDIPDKQYIREVESFFEILPEERQKEYDAIARFQLIEKDKE